MKGSHHALFGLSYTAVEALLRADTTSVAIVPAGSVEAHGPHLPLGTDTLISQAVAERSARALAELGYLAVHYPPLHYGVTDWADGFAGTTSISADVIGPLVLQTCQSALALGFDHIVLTNAHLEPGHIQTLRAVAKQFETQTGSPLLFVDKTRRKQAQKLTAEFQSGSCHAGQYETSLILAIRPDLVDRSAAAALPALQLPLHERIAQGAQNFAECGLDNAYCGAPAAATAEEGERTLQTLAQMVVDAVQAASTSNDPPLPQTRRDETRR